MPSFPIFVSRLVVFSCAVLVVASECRGQWLTQTNELVSGWNAVYLHVDASHTTIDQGLPPATPGHPIEEIWYWQPALPTGQFVTSPGTPSTLGNRWVKWQAGFPTTSALNRLIGNGAYLVKVRNDTPTYSWTVTGKPVIPTYQWTLTGLNFIGFPVNPSPAPSFEAFTLPALDLQQNGDFYGYVGGDLSESNPVSITALRTVRVQRNQAYWARAGETYSDYYGPVQIVQADASGIQFGDSVGQTRFRLRNLASETVVVTMSEVQSESAPAGQPAVQGSPTLLLRGPIDTTDLSFGYTEIGAGPSQWTLNPVGQEGSEVEVIIGVNRTTMTGPVGSTYASILRFTDSLGLTQVDMSVSATKTAAAGLWVGEARVDYVGHYLKPFASATNLLSFTNLLDRLQLAQGADGYRYEWNENTGRVLVFGGPDNKTGSYLLDGPIKVDSGEVPRPFPLRLIIHNDGTHSRLLQKVYNGMGVSSNQVVATKENLLLKSKIDSARRISAVHLPTSEGNAPWILVGVMQPAGFLITTVNLSYDDSGSNPFLHGYHPDHDNLDAQFTAALPQGRESYGVSRQITMNFTAPTDDFEGLTRGSRSFVGNYSEVMTFRARGSQTKEFHVLGTFSIARVSPIAELTTQ